MSGISMKSSAGTQEGAAAAPPLTGALNNVELSSFDPNQVEEELFAMLNEFKRQFLNLPAKRLDPAKIAEPFILLRIFFSKQEDAVRERKNAQIEAKLKTFSATELTVTRLEENADVLYSLLTQAGVQFKVQNSSAGYIFTFPASSFLEYSEQEKNCKDSVPVTEISQLVGLAILKKCQRYLEEYVKPEAEKLKASTEFTGWMRLCSTKAAKQRDAGTENDGPPT